MADLVRAPAGGEPDPAANVDGVPARTGSAWRYAVYFAPRPSHPLAAAARRWLGRDAERSAADHDDRARGAPPDAGIELAPDEWRSLVAKPSRYGFHATLKPPFRPAPGVGDAQVRLIPVDDVCYFQANDKYTSVFTAEGEALIRTPLKELAAQLDPDRFWQVHRGTIVNLAHVASTSRDLAGRVSIALRMRPEKVAVSRAFAHLFRQM